MSNAQIQAAQALKSVARNAQMKTYIQQSAELYPFLLQVSKRFITGESSDEALATGNSLLAKGYAVSLEYIGENTASIDECQQAKNEFLNLIEKMGTVSMKQTVSLDLSHIGLAIDAALTLSHLIELAEKAKRYDITLMISMEESSKTDEILSIYKKVSKQYPNIGITIQVYLYRSDQDIKELMHYPGKIRLVKGAYEESSDLAMIRSKELDERYLKFAKLLMAAHHPLSIATHDEMIIKELKKDQSFHQPNVETEMLYGVCSNLMKNLKEEGYHTKVYLTYGKDWYLYLCHRIAEYPENLYHAVVDMIHAPGKIDRAY